MYGNDIGNESNVGIIILRKWNILPAKWIRSKKKWQIENYTRRWEDRALSSTRIYHRAFGLIPSPFSLMCLQVNSFCNSKPNTERHFNKNKDWQLKGFTQKHKNILLEIVNCYSNCNPNRSFLSVPVERMLKIREKSSSEWQYCWKDMKFSVLLNFT